MNKYHAKRTFSNICDMFFASRLEATRGEELHFLELAGEITDLEYQVSFILCVKPKITVSIDFKYKVNGNIIYEDAKGILTRDSRTKYAWLKEKYDVEVKLYRH